jgi:hypothetical protein
VSVHPQVRVVVRPYGSAVPLGFFAFGIGMFLYAALDAPWVKQADAPSIDLILLAFVAPLEIIAMYGGIAFLLEDALGHTGLPLGRRGGSREAIEGTLGDQLRGLEGEAGVRHTL